MELCLIHEDLWDRVTTSTDDAAALTPEETRKDQRARAKICLMVQFYCLIHVKNAKTAWNNLQSAFENKG